MSIPNDVFEVANTLLRKTENDEVKWMETAGEGRFYCAIGARIVQVWSGTTTVIDDNDEPQEIGTITLRLAGEKFDDEIYRIEFSQGEENYSLFRSLYEAALLKARNVEGVLGEILTDLHRAPEEMSQLAQQLLKLHEASPSTIRYADGKLLAAAGIENIDKAYAELENKNKVRQVMNVVSVGGVPRRMYILRQ